MEKKMQRVLFAGVLLGGAALGRDVAFGERTLTELSARTRKDGRSERRPTPSLGTIDEGGRTAQTKEPTPAVAPAPSDATALKSPEWTSNPQTDPPAVPAPPPSSPGQMQGPPNTGTGTGAGPTESTPSTTPPPAPLPPPPTVVQETTSTGAAAPMVLDDFRIRPNDMQTMVLGSTEVSPARTGRGRLTFNVFGDQSFVVPQSSGPHAPPAFAIGALDLLTTAHLGGGVSATAELLFTGNSTGQVDTVIERFHLRWQNQYFLVVAGRFHSELGYWNNAYHHGKWLQLPIDRPRVVRFDSAQELIPAHMVGLQLGANIPLRSHYDAASLNIRLEIGNGRGSIASAIQQRGDDNDAKAFVLKIELQGIGDPALRIGLAGAYDRIPGQSAMVRPALPNTAIHEAIGAAYVAFPSTRLTLIAETYLFKHFAAGRDWTTFASFLVAGYRFGAWTPYVVVDHQHLRGGPDPYFVPNPNAPAALALGDTLEGIAGLRWDVSTWSALKFEYGQTHPVYAPGLVAFRGAINWSFGI